MEIHTLQELENRIISCRKCPRLVAWREEVGAVKRKAYRDQVYWARPVPGFGDPNAQVLVVGLAPGAHGSNRTGRMFTGDASGSFLYPALWRAGFANQPDGMNVNDGLKLKNLFITAVCRCAPPDNKPDRGEITNCHDFLEAELGLLTSVQGIVALGRLAWDEITREMDHVPSFDHGALLEASEAHPWVLASYHPSRQNTQTGRLTAQMFDQIWNKANQLLVN